MIEKIGNIFFQPDADAICFTSNGILNSEGHLVMGAGIAKAFKERFPYLPRDFGKMVSVLGNHVHCSIAIGPYIFSFPTKYHWKDPSDLKLIRKSAHQLVSRADIFSREKIYLTRPGCGLGGLQWEDVKQVISPILDDRFTILTPK